MISKLMPENLVELPRDMIEALGHPSHFEIAMEDGRLVLTPTPAVTAEQVFEKLESLGLTESDVEDAVAWARQTVAHKAEV